MKYFHKSLYFPNQIFQNGYVTPCYSSCQNGEGLHGCHSSNRFLWLELQSTSFVADQKLPYLDFAAQCRHLNSITTNPIQGESCCTLWNCRKCRSPTPNWRCHHPSILASYRPLELAEFWVVGGRSWLLCLT
ncbi:uncharacterized protein [Pyrus communis]|uniref:uncharacterized protein isoform X7 n=1 Tax=Pyrus communis TaxID=23211 RepID=UPI0035C17783